MNEETYSVNMDQNSPNSLIEEYADFARLVVRKIMKHLSIAPGNFDELLSAGYLGLVEAANRYDSKFPNSFRTYAYYRIRGAVIDHLRASNELSAKGQRFASALEKAHQLKEIEADKIRREGKDGDPAETLEGSLARVLEHAMQGALVYKLASLSPQEEFLLGESKEYQPADTLIEEREFRLLLRKLIEKLPEKEKLIVKEYYLEGKSFVEIVRDHPQWTKSWVSRLHSRALEILKSHYLEYQSLQRGSYE